MEGLLYYSHTPEILIGILARISRHQFARRAKEHGVARSQWLVLNSLSLHRGITLSALAETLEMATITTGRLVDRLEKLGWAERRPSPTDRREKLIFLTEESRDTVMELHAIVDQLNEETFSILTKKEYDELNRLLKMVHKSVTEKM